MDDNKNNRRHKILEARTQMPHELLDSPATEEELRQFEESYGAIPEPYRWFLRNWGGGVVGREHLDGIHSLKRSHDKYLREYGLANGWTMKDVFVIGWDGTGNPIAIERASGRILIEDHDSGAVYEEASSLESYLQLLLI